MRKSCPASNRVTLPSKRVLFHKTPFPPPPPFSRANFALSHVNGSLLFIKKSMKSSIAWGGSMSRVTILPGSTLLYINRAKGLILWLLRSRWATSEFSFLYSISSKLISSLFDHLVSERLFLTRPLFGDVTALYARPNPKHPRGPVQSMSNIALAYVVATDAMVGVLAQPLYISNVRRLRNVAKYSMNFFFTVFTLSLGAVECRSVRGHQI